MALILVLAFWISLAVVFHGSQRWVSRKVAILLMMVWGALVSTATLVYLHAPRDEVANAK